MHDDWRQPVVFFTRVRAALGQNGTPVVQERVGTTYVLHHIILYVYVRKFVIFGWVRIQHV